jgi:hypothetical protein
MCYGGSIRDDNYILKTLSLIQVIVITQSPVMVKNPKNVISVYDTPEFAHLVKFEVIDQGSQDELVSRQWMRITHVFLGDDKRFSSPS